jgi:hypothetical protein
MFNFTTPIFLKFNLSPTLKIKYKEERNITMSFYLTIRNNIAINFYKMKSSTLGIQEAQFMPENLSLLPLQQTPSGLSLILKNRYHPENLEP